MERASSEAKSPRSQKKLASSIFDDVIGKVKCAPKAKHA